MLPPDKTNVSNLVLQRAPLMHRRRFFRPRLWRLEHRTVPTVYTVTNAADSGAGSFRVAVQAANSLIGADTIQFDAVVFATPQTIVLGGGTINITDALTIKGPTSALTLD